jgi:hypothetical protein
LLTQLMRKDLRQISNPFNRHDPPPRREGLTEGLCEPLFWMLRKMSSAGIARTLSSACECQRICVPK